MIRSLSLIITSLLLTACATDFDRIYEGKYSWGSEVRSFSPCNSDTSYWVSFDWAGRDMHDFYVRHSRTAYPFMYVKFRGHLLDEQVDGFALGYDGLIRISEVQEYRFEIPPSCE